MTDSASFCLKCDKVKKCENICDELEATLPKPGSGRLEGEFSFDPFYLDFMEKREKGKRKKPIIYDNNHEIE